MILGSYPNSFLNFAKIMMEKRYSKVGCIKWGAQKVFIFPFMIFSSPNYRCKGVWLERSKIQQLPNIKTPMDSPPPMHKNPHPPCYNYFLLSFSIIVKIFHCLTIEKSIFFTQKGEKNGKSADILETKFVNPTKGEKELNFISQKRLKWMKKLNKNIATS